MGEIVIEEENTPQTNNVIAFTGGRVRNTLPSTMKEVEESLQANRAYFVDEFLTIKLQELMNQLFFNGFPVDNPDFLKRVIMCGEIYRSVLYNSIDVPHPLYKLIEENIEEFVKKSNVSEVLDAIEMDEMDDE
jgi:hypothetical protein